MIRMAVIEDAGQIQEIYRYYVYNTAISFEQQAPDAAEMARRLAEILAHWPWLVWEAPSDKQLLGYAYAKQFSQREAYRWSVEVSVYLRQGFGGRGIGKALYRRLLEILGDCGFVNAFAGIVLPNPSSVALHESLGFEQVGLYRAVGYKMERWHDVGWWGLQLQEPLLEPPAPVKPQL